MLLGLAGACSLAGASRPVPPPVRQGMPLPGSFLELLDLRSASRLKPWRTLQASGYDRGGGFYDSGNFLREEPGPRYVLMEERGPGCIDRMWFTRKSTRETYDLLFYLDGDRSPTIRIDMDELCSGRRSPFLPPFVGSVDLARYSYVPLGFRRSCRVVLVPTAPADRYTYRENSAGKKIPHVYYQLTYRKLPPGTRARPYRARLEGEEFRAQGEAAALWQRAGSWPWGALPEVLEENAPLELPAGGEAGLFETEPAGVIYGIQLRLPPGVSTAPLSLEMSWDGASTPAVSVPLGVFFAAPDPRVEARGLWLGGRDGEYYCYLPLPFRKGCRLRLRSSGDAPVRLNARVRWRWETPSPEDGYFHASRYDYSPPLPAADYGVLNARGRGHWIGLVMDRPGNMEGDDRFYVDGEREPSIHGTGTEDFFSFAWGFSHLGAFPLHGITRHSGAPVLYRFHLPAAVPFRRSLRLTFEHGSGNEHQGRYSGVACFYSDRPGSDREDAEERRE